jgi:CheY-like chemotaxis protein
MLTPRILIVDDDASFLEAYAQILGDEGYVMTTASTREDALTLLSRPEGWDVVLLDQKLHGPGGSDTGFDLLKEARDRAPGARVMIVTAFATDPAIRDAFEQGAYDYLEKTPRLPALLQAKIASAWGAIREAKLAQLAAEQREEEISETWSAVRHEQDSQVKGAQLENLTVLLLQTIGGFVRAEVRRRNEIEEIDVLVANESDDAGWRRESQFILFECKNWSRRVGRPELDLFAKLQRRHGRCNLGFFVALGGFASTFALGHLADSKSPLLVVPIGFEEFEKLVTARDRSEVLKYFRQRSIISADGA